MPISGGYLETLCTKMQITFLRISWPIWGFLFWTYFNNMQSSARYAADTNPQISQNFVLLKNFVQTPNYVTNIARGNNQYQNWKTIFCLNLTRTINDHNWTINKKDVAKQLL